MDNALSVPPMSMCEHCGNIEYGLRYFDKWIKTALAVGRSGEAGPIGTG